MKWFNRLFWKIFLAFWLASLSVIIVTVLVVGELAERDSVRQVFEYRAREQAQKIIVWYETGNIRLPYTPRKSREKKHDNDDHRSSKRSSRWLSMNIYDAEGMLIFGKQAEQQSDRVITLDLESSSGKNYVAKVNLEPATNHFARLQAFLFSVQAILVLIASTLASILLTIIVVRPVNRLREYVEQFHGGQFNLRIEPGLLKRGDEIGALAREFQQMAVYVDRTMQGQQRLLQDVSHELRAPLARLQVATGLAEQKLGSESKITQRINLECERLSRLIDEMLTLARLDNIEAQESRFDVANVVDEALGDISFSQPDRKITVLNKLSSPGYCQGNSELLMRALSNVFGNILKHTNADCAVDVVLAPSDKKCMSITIRDYGEGVSEEALASLFEPFYRHNNNANSFGLGLSIAKRAVERLHGSIQAKNMDEGFAVILQLPLAPADR
ncbi:ATP-binding protein [Neptunomonas qingdaonensis]|uniref:histidine kinase n=1 Tax=Neptunomonas qingdaonensis TaxID=1045558 RepID=A0A1I2LXZ8_9GAMM|nr:ATP-binding protein [Neptunomonas qingdaonensis]SFF83339.1 two-component system, OmpR family, sensor kinase/two-component system, OmpR family, sensor histidine kinase CpxA [Neptunomonas qingdaonensis]